jgi:hypothetical protein
LDIGGRIYQVDQYGTWVSYLRSARERALSNYQFSTSHEWFAEAYAAFYDPNPAPRGQLSQPVRDWFQDELPALTAWLGVSGEARFGGWQQHIGPAGVSDVADAVIAKAGITAADVADGRWAQFRGKLAELLESPRAADTMDGLRALADEFAPGDAEFPAKIWQARRMVARAIGRPWTLDDGGAAALGVEGRIYQVTSDGTWVSYLPEAREGALSNHQFSAPQNWFWEAWAAFHDPDRRGLLSDDARIWFERQLAELTGAQSAGAGD